MARNNKLEKINIKSCTCYYFHKMTNINDLDVDDIFIEQNIIWKYCYAPYGVKTLCFIFDKVHGK